MEKLFHIQTKSVNQQQLIEQVGRKTTILSIILLTEWFVH